MRTLFARMCIWARGHMAGIVFAVFVGFFMVGPEIISQINLGDGFMGIRIHGSDGEVFYLARMNQVYNGISAWDSPFLYEYRGELPLTYALFAEPTLAHIGKWLGIPAQELNLIYKFIFSVFIFLLIYAFAFRLMGDRRWSVATAVFIMLGYRLVTIPGFINFISWHTTYSQFLLFSRPVTSQISWVIFWSFLHVILSGIQTKKTRYFLFSGILLGISFYVYLYAWTFLFTLTGVLAVIAIFSRHREVVVKTTMALLIGISIGLPYIFNIFNVVGHEYFDTFKIITFLHESRAPDISKIGLVVAVLFLLRYKYISNWKERDVFLVALIAATFIVTNQQILTNRVLEVGHYHLFFNVFVYILALMYLGRLASDNIRSGYVRLLPPIVIIFSFLNGYLFQSASYSNQFYRVKNEQKYADAFLWLNEHTRPRSVILAHDRLSLLASVYTHNFVFWSTAAQLYMVPPDRLEIVLFTFMRLNGIHPRSLGGESFFHESPTAEQLDLASRYPDVDMLLYIPSRRAYKDGMQERYEEFFKKEFEDGLSEYRIDYIIKDITRKGWDDSYFAKYFRPVYSSNGIQIFQRISK